MNAKFCSQIYRKINILVLIKSIIKIINTYNKNIKKIYL